METERDESEKLPASIRWQETRQRGLVTEPKGCKELKGCKDVM